VPWLLGPIIVSNKDCYIRVENILIAGFISLTRVTRQKHVTVVDIFILNWGGGGVLKCSSVQVAHGRLTETSMVQETFSFASLVNI